MYIPTWIIVTLLVAIVIGSLSGKVANLLMVRAERKRSKLYPEPFKG